MNDINMRPCGISTEQSEYMAATPPPRRDVGTMQRMYLEVWHASLTYWTSPQRTGNVKAIADQAEECRRWIGKLEGRNVTC